MALRPFDFADLPREHAGLRAMPDSPELRTRLRDRVERGPVPSCAAAVLAERGDPGAIPALAALAPFLDRPDMEALGSSTGTLAQSVADALACAIASVVVPMPSRQAALELFKRIAVTPASLAVVLEVGERDRDPLARAARTIGAELLNRAERPTRLESDRLRNRAASIRTWVGIRRQELQREVATGSLAPCVAAMAGDPAFLAGLVPPIADEARPALIPALLAAARAADEPIRARLFALFQGRFRDVAREPLSILARFVALKGRDARVPLLALDRLVAFGAWRDVLVASVSGNPDVRTAALVALAQPAARTWIESERSLVEEAASWLAHTGDGLAAERLRVIG